MAKSLQLRGGTTSEHSTFKGAAREVTVDTDKDTLVVHDGTTEGGFCLAKETDVLLKSGGTMVGDIAMGSNKITGLSAPVSTTDAATKDYVDNNSVYVDNDSVYVSVTDSPYDATKDGTTDDTTAINDAISAVNTAGGGTVFFPAGTYSVSQIDLKENVRLLGESKYSTILKANTINKNIVNYQKATSSISGDYDSYFAVEELTLNGNAKTGLNGIFLNGVKETLTGTLTPTNDSTTIAGTLTFFESEVSIGDNLLISGVVSTVSAITSDTSLTIETPFPDDTSASSLAAVFSRIDRVTLKNLFTIDIAGNAIDLYLSSNNTIETVKTTACDNGLYLENCTDTDVSNCSFQTDVGFGIYILGGPGAFDEGVRLSNCSTNAQTNGLYIENQSWGSVTNSSFTTTTSGSSEGYPVSLVNTQDWQFTGCQFASAAPSTTYANFMMDSNCSNIQIGSCFFALAAYGISTSASGCALTGNSFYGNTTADLHLRATATGNTITGNTFKSDSATADGTSSTVYSIWDDSGTANLKNVIVGNTYVKPMGSISSNSVNANNLDVS